MPGQGRPARSNPNLLELRGLDRAELIKLQTTLGFDIDSIKSQLEKARTESRKTGKRAAEGWYQRASGKLRVKGRQVQQIQARLVELQARRKKGVTQSFMRHAERLLPRPDFNRILEEALKECRTSKPTEGEELEKEDLS